MERPVPFEALPAARAPLRLRALRDGLIISGWLATAFVFAVLVPAASSLGYDAFSYWSIELDDMYGRAMSSNFALGAFRYAPPVGFLFAPLGALPWWLFLLLWVAVSIAIVLWLGGRWALALIALPPVALEIYHGNVHLLMAAAIALGFRFPWLWTFVILAKITPGVGLLWFAVRREWRNLALALGATALVSIVTLVVAPHYWTDFVRSILSNLSEPQYYSIPPGAPVRIPFAVALVVWGARTDRPWTVAVAATLALPIVWPHGLAVCLAAVPFLRRGDRAALTTGWQRAAAVRPLLVALAVLTGGALLLASLFPGPVRSVLDDASDNLRPYESRA